VGGQSRFFHLAIRRSLFVTRHSPLAIRHPLPFRLADLPISRFAENLARQEPRPPIFPPLVPRPSSRSVLVPCPLPHVPSVRSDDDWRFGCSDLLFNLPLPTFN
jgi:hypothetical protein